MKFIQIQINSGWYPVDEYALRVGVVISELRKAADFTSAELAAKIGRSGWYLNRVELGVVQAKAVDYFALADALNVKRSELFTRAEALNWKAVRQTLEDNNKITWQGGRINPANPIPPQPPQQKKANGKRKAA